MVKIERNWWTLGVSDVDLRNVGGLKELEKLQNYTSGYKIIVYGYLSHDGVIFEGNSVLNKKLYLLYDADSEHYNANTNL